MKPLTSTHLDLENVEHYPDPFRVHYQYGDGDMDYGDSMGDGDSREQTYISQYGDGSFHGFGNGNGNGFMVYDD
jgi:hypothetical protein